MNNIHQVLEYGSIVASNDDLDILITANGAYYNFWCGDYSGKYNCTDCRYIDLGMDGLYGADMVKIIEGAEKYLEDALAEDMEEDDDC